MSGTEWARPERVVVPVVLGDRSYEIIIGRDLLPEAGARIAALLPGSAVAVVTDRHVGAAHGDRLAQALQSAGIRASTITIAPGEASKSYSQFAELCDGLIAARIERKDVVLALGGGVVGDLSGFASASIRRGTHFVQMPTSLLAQVDSSVGGKTGINSPLGKNLIGAFHQPSLVLCDTALLDTLPLREMRAGYAEVVKYGLINRPDFFDWCEANWHGIHAGGPEREHAVAEACRAKADVVARDEREEGDRALLNLGHTFAHALERVTAYDSARLVHGEAVSIGMVLAFKFSQSLGLCAGQDVERVRRHLDAAGLPTRLDQVPGGVGSVDQLMEAMAQDKKVSRGQMTFILTRGIGQSFIAKGVEAQVARSFLEAALPDR
jgi:3-dehydroquinate synthase